MGKHAKLTAPGSLQFKRLLPGSPEKIWDYFTDSDKRGKWLASGPMELRAEGELTFNFLHSDLSEEHDPIPDKFKQYEKGDTMHGKVLLVEPAKKLVFTWAGDSELSIDLSPKEDNTSLVLTHSGLGSDTDTLIGVAAGWHTHLEILEDILYGKKPKGFWKTYNHYEDYYREHFK